MDVTEDHYGGVIATVSKPADCETAFGTDLDARLTQWRSDNKRGVWLKVMKDCTGVLPVAIAAGFEIHHARSQYIMLNMWLPDTPSTLPNFCTHNVGVGGFVVNERGEILMVQERQGPIVNIWKLPGGSVDPGEDIDAAAVREVFEETGIKAEFQSVLSFRQAHGFQFGASDVYFVCKLRALTTDISRCEREIAACKWMTPDEFNTIPFYKGLYRRLMDVSIASTAGYEGFPFEELPIVFRPGTGKLYHACKL